MYNTLITRILL